MKKSRFKITLRLIAPLLTILLTFGGTLSACAEDIFKDLAGQQGVSSTYLSGKLADKAMSHLSKNSGLRNIDLSSGFTSLYSYECYMEQPTLQSKRILAQYLKTHSDLELMIKKVDSFGEYYVFQKFNSSGEVTQMVIWNRQGPEFCDIVVIDWKNGHKK